MANIQKAVYEAPPFLLSATRPDAVSTTCDNEHSDTTTAGAAQAKLKRCRFSFSEQIIWTEPLCGAIPLTEKEIADNIAIGGLRNTAESVGRLHMVAQFRKRLGTAICKLVCDSTAEQAARGTPNASWVNTTCDAIGSDDPDWTTQLLQWPR